MECPDSGRVLVTTYCVVCMTMYRIQPPSGSMFLDLLENLGAGLDRGLGCGTLTSPIVEGY